MQPGVEASADVVEGGDAQPMALHTRTWIRPTAIDELRKARRSAPSTAKEPCIEVGRITVNARDTPPTFFRFKAKFEEPPVVIAMLQEHSTCFSQRAHQLDVRIEGVTTEGFQATLLGLERTPLESPTQVTTVREGQTMHLPSSSDLEILSARYYTPSRSVDVTWRVRGFPRSFGVSNSAMGGDPHPGVVKMLDVHWRIRIHTVVVNSLSAAYLAMPAGVYKFADGHVVEAGRISTRRQVFGGHLACSTTKARASWDQVEFQYKDFKSAPAVFATVQTMNNEQHNVPLMPSTPWLEAARGLTNKTHAQVSLERTTWSTHGRVLVDEEIGYVALERGGSDRTYGGWEVISQTLHDQGAQTVTNFRTVKTPRPLVFANQASRRLPDGGYMCHVGFSNGAADPHVRPTLVVVRNGRCQSGNMAEDVDMMIFAQAFHMKLEVM